MLFVVVFWLHYIFITLLPAQSAHPRIFQEVTIMEVYAVV